MSVAILVSVHYLDCNNILMTRQIFSICHVAKAAPHRTTSRKSVTMQLTPYKRETYKYFGGKNLQVRNIVGTESFAATAILIQFS
jgi:hypothetical protein